MFFEAAETPALSSCCERTAFPAKDQAHGHARIPHEEGRETRRRFKTSFQCAPYLLIPAQFFGNEENIAKPETRLKFEVS
jgi:hypothetical protein